MSVYRIKIIGHTKVKEKDMFDVVIIGAGVVGAMVARTLSKYDLSVCLVEKENDVAMGATKANSAIVHAGFDAKEGSLKAKLNVEGASMMEEVAKELSFKYKNNGSIVVGFDEEDLKTINALYERGVKNGVKELKVLTGDEAREIEPNLTKEVTCALYAPTAGIVCPYELTIGAVGNAMDNGVIFKRNFEVVDIKKENEVFVISSKEESVSAKYIVNCAGLYSDKIASMVGDNSFAINPRRGEYILLDRECGNMAKSTIFSCPTKAGKGILVSPTVDGNLLLGPTSEEIDDKEDTSTTQSGLSDVIAGVKKKLNGIMINKSITSFTGLRAAGNTGDFIINAKDGFVNCAGIESPGLSSAPAIAKMVASLLEKEGLTLKEKADYNPIRKHINFSSMTIEEKNEVIKKDKAYGKIVCRCECITEGEILEAIKSNPKPLDLDGVKRRTRSQMGRCQGGFCSPYIMELLAKEMGVSKTEITKKGKGSKMLVGVTKGDK